MTATELEKNIYGDDVKIISRTDDCTVYRLEDGVGYIDMTCYSVFPGIDLVYDDVHMHGNFRKNAKPGIAARDASSASLKKARAIWDPAI